MRDPVTQTLRDEDYLDFIRDQPCLVCGEPSPSDPHHLDSGVMGSKGSDWTCVPLCRRCHAEYHQKGEHYMQEHYAVKFWREAHRLLERYHKSTHDKHTQP